MSGRLSKFEDHTIATIFIIVVFLFCLFSIIHCGSSAKSVSVDEKRRLAALPSLGSPLSDLAKSFEAFYNDRFPLRVPLVGARNLKNYALFHISGNSRILAGRDDWLFYLDAGDREIMRHCPLFSQSDLSIWSDHFERRRAWLAKRHIKYVLFFAPSKCEIYPEFLPDEYLPVNEQSRQDQLLGALKNRTAVDFIDLRPALLSAKGQFKYALYYKTDTHWNTLGAFIAYREIARQLALQFKTIEPLDVSDIEITPGRISTGDLAHVMGLKGQLSEKSAIANNKRPFHWLRLPNVALPDELNESGVTQYFSTHQDRAQLPKAFVICDSFMDYLQPLLSENFRTALFYYWPSTFPSSLIEKEMPDVVIEEVAERGLAVHLEEDPEDVRLCLSRLSHVR